MPRATCRAVPERHRSASTRPLRRSTSSTDAVARTVKATATDAASGVASIEYRSHGEPSGGLTGTVLVGLDETKVELRATDKAGNVSARRGTHGADQRRQAAPQRRAARDADRVGHGRLEQGDGPQRRRAAHLVRRRHAERQR